MKKEEFFNIMNDIDDDLLVREARAAAEVKGKKLRLRRFTALVAVVIVTAVCLSVIVPVLSGKDEENIVLTPEMVGSMYGKLFNTDGYIDFYDYYNQVWTSKILVGEDIPDCDSLPIYRISSLDNEKEEFLEFINTNINSLVGIMGLSYTEEVVIDQIRDPFNERNYTFSEEISFEKIGSEEIGTEEMEDPLKIRCRTDINKKEMKIYTRTNGPVIEKLKFNGSYVGISMTDSEDEIKAQLSDMISYICETFGKSYQNILIEKTHEDGIEDNLNVYLYNQEETALPSMFPVTSTASEYIQLTFVQSYHGVHYHWNEPDDKAYLRSISYVESVLDCEDYYQNVGEYNMITLEKAEEMLSKGYVFQNYSPCKALSINWDFMKYDFVNIEYMMGENGLVLPFYTFYESMDNLLGYCTSDALHVYAVVRVLALEIEGMEEYFKNKEPDPNEIRLGESFPLYDLWKSDTEENCYYGYDVDGKLCRVYYEGNDIIEDCDYYINTLNFSNLDYPEGTPSDAPVYEVYSHEVNRIGMTDIWYRTDW